MKILKVIFVLALVVVVAYLVAAFVGPKDYKVERTLGMNVSQQNVWKQVSYFKNWRTWSPWVEQDPGVKHNISEIDGQVGTTNHWEGDPNSSGTGSMTITKMVDLQSMSYNLDFVIPFEMSSKGSISLEVKDNKTYMTWVDEADIPFVMRPMMLFFDIEKELGDCFDRGLFKIDSLGHIMDSQEAELIKQEAETDPAELGE
ncbi:SRPBCC family protein [Fibrobacterales bacterium]|nr:SRPBCC family protein [Fibrobacterales bacterium]